MKIITSIIVLTIVGKSAVAQNQHSEKGEINTHISVEFLSPLLLSGPEARFSMPPIFATVEYGATEAVGIGGYLATARSSIFS